VPDLKDEPPVGRNRDKCIGFLESGGHRFFYQHVHAVVQELFGNQIMGRGGNHNADRIHPANEIGMPAERPCLQAVGHSSGGGYIDVRHAHQFDIRHAGVLFRMKFTEIADPDNADAKFVIDCAHKAGPV
jgi:hypothetical protein